MVTEAGRLWQRAARAEDRSQRVCAFAQSQHAQVLLLLLCLRYAPCGCCRYVLCGLYDRGAVQAWSVDDPEWACKIDENPAGIKACR